MSDIEVVVFGSDNEIYAIPKTELAKFKISKEAAKKLAAASGPDVEGMSATDGTDHFDEWVDCVSDNPSFGGVLSCTSQAYDNVYGG